jgi:hypothetical protein
LSQPTGEILSSPSSADRTKQALDEELLLMTPYMIASKNGRTGHDVLQPWHGRTRYRRSKERNVLGLRLSFQTRVVALSGVTKIERTSVNAWNEKRVVDAVKSRGLAVLALVLRVDKHAVDENVVTLVERVGGRLAEAVGRSPRVSRTRVRLTLQELFFRSQVQSAIRTISPVPSGRILERTPSLSASMFRELAAMAEKPEKIGCYW